MDSRPPSCPVHGISQARILEWVAISFIRGSSWPRDWTWVSCIAGRFFTTEPPGKVKVKSLSPVRLFATLWTVAYQAPPSMGFSRQGYWSGLSFSSPGDLANPGIEPGSPTLQADALTSEPPGKPEPPGSPCIFMSRFGRWLGHEQCGRPWFNPWVGKIPWRRKWQSTPVPVPGKSHGPRSLVGYSPWHHKDSDTSEWLYFLSLRSWAQTPHKWGQCPY